MIDADHAQLTEQLQRHLDRLWEYVADDRSSRDALLAASEEVESLVPDEEATESWTPSVPRAANATAAVAYALRCAGTGEPQYAVWCARQAVEAIDFEEGLALPWREVRPADNASLERAPRLQQELRRQEEDLELSAEVRSARDSDAIARVRGQ